MYTQKESIIKYHNSRKEIARKTLQNLDNHIPFSSSTLFCYKKLLHYMERKLRKKSCSFHSALFTSHPIYVINFNTLSLIVLIVRSLLGYKTSFSIHDVKPHPGGKYYLILVCTFISVILATNIVVYSNSSKNYLLSNYKRYTSSVYVYPLEGFWYEY